MNALHHVTPASQFSTCSTHWTEREMATIVAEHYCTHGDHATHTIHACACGVTLDTTNRNAQYTVNSHQPLPVHNFGHST